jgi:hypothetical protein
VAKCWRLRRTILVTAVEEGLLVANLYTAEGADVEPIDARPPLTVAQATTPSVEALLERRGVPEPDASTVDRRRHRAASLCTGVSARR